MNFPPHGLTEIVLTYGDAHAYVDTPAIWEEQILRFLSVPPGLFLYAGKPVRNIRVHQLTMQAFGYVFKTLFEGGLWGIEYGGTYNYRLNRNNPKKLSTHCWGIAIDINPSRCPMGSDPARQDQRIVHAFQQYGFTWLQNDPMHFQLCDGY